MDAAALPVAAILVGLLLGRDRLLLPVAAALPIAAILISTIGALAIRARLLAGDLIGE